MAFPDTQRLVGWISDRARALESKDALLLVELMKLYFRRFRGAFALIFIMLLIISGATAGIALLVKDFVNEIFVAGSSVFIYLFFVALVIFTIKGAATFFQSVLSARIANEIVADVRARLFEHALRQRMDFFVAHNSDDLLTRFNQGAAGFSNILTAVLVNGLRDLLQVVALVAVMVTQDLLLTVGSLVVAPVIYIGIVLLLRKIRSITEMELAGYTELNRRVREMVQGISVIKSFNLEEPANRAARSVIDGLKMRGNRIAMLQNGPQPLLDTAGGIAVGIAVLYAGFRVGAGGYDAGTFMSFLTALLLAADPARRLSQLRVVLRTSFVMVELVFEVLNQNDPEPSGGTLLRHYSGNGEAPAAGPPSIDLDNVEFAYRAASPVLNGLTLNIASGETIALVGPSGSGKSTIFKLLLRFYDPTSGTIKIDGTDLTDIEPHAVRDVVAYVGQSNFIFRGSIRDNLRLMDETVPDSVIRDACEQVGLDSYIDGLRKGFDTDVGELGTSISGGQAQRLNLARAIIKDSPVLLLDEVTSALDAENELLVKQTIARMRGKKTILVIAHRLSTVSEVDRIALLRDGQIVDVGPHDELSRRNDYYGRLVALQHA